tara:strand:+ start:456 stop:1424 length:969 start_codon:yes stop_codon:yes gene_type:complete
MFTKEISKTRTAKSNYTQSLKTLESYLDSFKREFTTTMVMDYGDTVISIRNVIITPSLATKILEDHNNRNRKKNNNNINYLAKQVVNDNWIANGETITFDINGDLNNGQHRLEAVIKTDTPMEALVVTNLSLEAFKTIDTGSLRSGSDVLSIEGVSNSTHMSAMVKFIFAFKMGKYSANRHHHRTLSNTELIDYYYELDEEKLYKAFQFYNKVRTGNSNIITPTYISGFYYLLNEIDGEKSEQFLTMLCQGINLTQDSPVMALRNKLIRAKVDKNYKLTNEELLKNLTYAWSKFINNKKTKSLKLPENYEVGLDTQINLDIK